MTAVSQRRYRWLFWTLALLGFAADQGSKYGIFTWLYSEERRQGICEGAYTIVPGTFDLVARHTLEPWTGDGLLHELRTISGPNIPLVNHGALFGIGAGTAFGNHLFMIVSLTAALAIVLWTCRNTAARDRYLCVALGLILAGTLGNFYDRIVFGGVRDFFHWYRWYDWPVFNFADCCLVSGAGLLVLEAFLREPEGASPPQHAISNPAAVAESTPL